MKHYGFYAIDPGLDTDVLQRFPTLRDMDTQSDGYPAGVYRYSLHGAYLEQNGVLRTVKDIYYKTQTRLESVIRSNTRPADYYFDTSGDGLIMAHKLENPIQFYDPRSSTARPEYCGFWDEECWILTPNEGAAISRVIFAPYLGPLYRGARSGFGLLGIRGTGLTDYTARYAFFMRGQLVYTNHTVAKTLGEAIPMAGTAPQKDGSNLAFESRDYPEICRMADGTAFAAIDLARLTMHYNYGAGEWGTDAKAPENAAVRTVVKEADRVQLVTDVGYRWPTSENWGVGLQWLRGDWD